MTLALNMLLYLFLTFCTRNFRVRGALGSLTIRNCLAKAVALRLDDRGTWVFRTLGSKTGIMTVGTSKNYSITTRRLQVSFDYKALIKDLSSDSTVTASE